jgi:hypothetical protein
VIIVDGDARAARRAAKLRGAATDLAERAKRPAANDASFGVTTHDEHQSHEAHDTPHRTTRDDACRLTSEHASTIREVVEKEAIVRERYSSSTQQAST